MEITIKPIERMPKLVEQMFAWTLKSETVKAQGAYIIENDLCTEFYISDFTGTFEGVWTFSRIRHMVLTASKSPDTEVIE